MRQSIFLIILTSLSFNFIKAQDMEKYERKLLVTETDTLPYRILFPENFDPSKKYPLVFFLHGRGERGNDNQTQLANGGSLFLREDIRKDFPAIVVFPQCATTSYWSNVEIITDGNGKRFFNFLKGGEATRAMYLALALLEKLKNRSYTDKSRFYVGGLSMGGMGTFEILRRRPKLFAAAFAICGGDNAENVRKYKDVPMWIFHGEKDDVVHPAYSQIIVNQFRWLGREVKYTWYPEANHNSWDSALAEKELLPWLFSHRNR